MRSRGTRSLIVFATSHVLETPLVPTHPWLFIVRSEKIFTGIRTNSMRKVMMTAKDKSPGTCLKWLSPLNDRPLIEKISHNNGKLKATPNIVVIVPG